MRGSYRAIRIVQYQTTSALCRGVYVAGNACAIILELRAGDVYAANDFEKSAFSRLGLYASVRGGCSRFRFQKTVAGIMLRSAKIDS